MKCPSIPLMTAAVVLFASQISQAGFLASGTGANGKPIAASADFSFSGGILTITLTNTSTFDYTLPKDGGKAVPTDVLTGLFFDYDGGYGPSLTFNTATTPQVTVGSNPLNLKASSTFGANSTVGGWAYREGAASLPGLNQHYGLGTTGFGIFNGDETNAGDGLPAVNFGVMNSLYEAGENNGGIGLKTPFAKNSITFSLSTTSSFDVSKVGNVRFQYGSSLNEEFLTPPPPGPGPLPTPEPASAVLLLLGAAGLGVNRRMSRQKGAPADAAA